MAIGLPFTSLQQVRYRKQAGLKTESHSLHVPSDVG
jgi:hypothetical protein